MGYQNERVTDEKKKNDNRIDEINEMMRRKRITARRIVTVFHVKHEIDTCDNRI